MDLLKSHKRRSRVSEITYVALNIALAIAILVIVRTVEASWLAYMVVLLGKWRALAVRPRFWFANLVANMVDIIVGLSTVVLMYAAENILWLQIAIVVLYTAWLLFIKPRSRRSYVAVQAGVAGFVGITALSIQSATWFDGVDPFLFVTGMWVIGYVCTRHVLGSYDEPMTKIYSMIAALFSAEMGWISYHWLFAYRGFGEIKLSQLAVYMALFGLVAERSYASYHKHGHIRKSDIIMPVLLTISIIVALFLIELVVSVVYGKKEILLN